MSAKDMTEELMKAQVLVEALPYICLLYTSDAADD